MNVEKRITEIEEMAERFGVSEIILYLEGANKDRSNMAPATQEVIREVQVEIARQRSQGSKLIVVLVRPGHIMPKNGNSEFRFF